MIHLESSHVLLNKCGCGFQGMESTMPDTQNSHQVLQRFHWPKSHQPSPGKALCQWGDPAPSAHFPGLPLCQGDKPRLSCWWVRDHVAQSTAVFVFSTRWQSRDKQSTIGLFLSSSPSHGPTTTIPSVKIQVYVLRYCEPLYPAPGPLFLLPDHPFSIIMLSTCQ